METKKDYKESLKNLKWAGKNTKFHLLAGINRPVLPGQVTKLANSINKMSIIRPIIVAKISFLVGGKEALYIIDGQHLFNALMRNNMEIPYICIDIDNKRDLIEKIALLNASSKSWTMLDYITAWASEVEDYKKLNSYYEVYDMELAFLASVFMNRSADSGDMTKKLKAGEFKMSDEDKNKQLLDYLTDVLKVIPRMNRFLNKYACREYIKFVRLEPNYNHKKFMNNLLLNKQQFVLATQENGKLQEMFKSLK